MKNDPWPFLPHGRQHFLRDQKRPPAGDMLRRIEHLHRDVFQQFLVRRKIASFQVARVVDQHLGIASFAADGGERRRDRILRDQIQLDDHAIAVLLADGVRECGRVSFLAGGQYDEKALLGELLREAPPTPQRAATGKPLSSTVWPWASKVLRPFACHLEVAPTTTATCLPFEFVLPFWLMDNFPFLM